MGFLYSHVLPQALPARQGLGGLAGLVQGWRTFVTRIKAIFMRQGTSMAHTEPQKLFSALMTHSIDMGSISWEPHAVAAKFLGTSVGAELPAVGLQVAKLLTQGNCHFTFRRTHGHRGRANNRWWQKDGPHVVVWTKRQPWEQGRKPAHLSDEECRQHSWKHLLWFPEAVAVGRGQGPNHPPLFCFEMCSL